MSIFNIPNPSKKDDRPEWLQNAPSETWQVIYDLVRARVSEVEVHIHGGTELAKRQRQIVKAQIADAAGVNVAYIDKRKMPEIVNFIDAENKRLDVLYSVREKPRVHKTKPVQDMKREELIELNRALSKRIDELTEVNVTEQLEHLISESLLDQQLSLRQNMANVEAENKKLLEVNANQRIQIQDLTNALTTAIKDKQTTERKYQELVQRKADIKSIR